MRFRRIGAMGVEEVSDCVRNNKVNTPSTPEKAQNG
jgi:hypothetical protein